jgi:type II secretory pathway pseudopilin PulG
MPSSTQGGCTTIEMKRTKRFSLRFVRRRGFSLIEVIVGIVMMTAALLGLAAAAAVGLRQTSRAREDSQYWGDAQRVIDSLISRGFNQSSTGSATVNGRTIEWIVGSGATAPQQIKIVVWRKGYTNRFTTVKDTVVLYLSRTTPGPS